MDLEYEIRKTLKTIQGSYTAGITPTGSCQVLYLQEFNKHSLFLSKWFVFFSERQNADHKEHKMAKAILNLVNIVYKAFDDFRIAHKTVTTEEFEQFINEGVKQIKKLIDKEKKNEETYDLSQGYAGLFAYD